MAHSFKNLKIVRESVIETFFCESIGLCKFNSSPAKNERKRMINIALASWHILLKNCVSDFRHVHLFFCDNKRKFEGTNHQHFLWKNDGYSKTEKENKNRRHCFQGKLSDNKLAKFQLNRFRGCRLGVKNVRLTFPNFRPEKTRKIYFFAASLPERDHLATTIGIWQVICSRPNLYAVRGGNTLYFSGGIQICSALEFLFIGDRPRKLKTFEAAAWPPPIARKPGTDARFIVNALLRRTALFWHWNIQWNQVRFYFVHLINRNF